MGLEQLVEIVAESSDVGEYGRMAGLDDIGGFSDDLDKLFDPQAEPLVLTGDGGGEES